MKLQRAVVIAFAAITLTVLVSTAPVVAQSGDPITFSGSVTTTDGTPAPEDTTIVAIVDEGNAGTVTVESAGQYGVGPGNSLVVTPEKNTTTVRFFVGSTDGPEATESPRTGVSAGGDYTQDLTFPEGTFDDGSDDGSDDAGSEDAGGGGGGGGAAGGGGGGGGGGGSSEADSGPPSLTDIHDRLNFVTAQTETTVSPSESAGDGGPTVEPSDTETVSRIAYNNPDLSGETQIAEYGEPPTLLEHDIQHSASQYIDDIETTTESGTVVSSSIDVVSVTDIEPTAEATVDQSATVDLRVPKENVDDPSNLGLIKEEYVFSEQETQWVQVDTEVEADGDAYVVTGTVEQFSLFAVTETDEADPSNPPGSEGEQSASTDDGTSDQAPGFGLLTAIMALSVGVAGLRLSRRS